ncbi:SRPBCC family protein [Stackebrandtia soli]|uniref:SRPBCC family protein n=1 Tax=Stackebrandtia soli TaxID=1892856 RepID=UPI0039ED1463
MTDTTITIERDFRAPRQLVFDAWTTAEQFAQWFGSLPARTSLDVTVGGKWSAIMEYEGKELTFYGEFQEIVEPERLVLSFTDGSGPGFATVTVDLTENDGVTHMTFSQVGPLPAEQVDAATEGWKLFFDELEKIVTA